MTNYELTEQLAAKCDVTLEEAMTALEASNWNTLTATHLLEQEKFRRMQELNAFAESGEAAATAVQAAPEEAAAEESATADEAGAEASVKIEAVEAPKASDKRSRGMGLKNLWSHVRRLIACGNRNRFAVDKGDNHLLEMPVTALVLLMLCAFWVCVPLLIVGLFTGCRYSFSGKELGRENINAALGKAADAADHVKHAVTQA